MATAGWQFWIDRGGTFTDIVGRAPDLKLHTIKLLSENPAQYVDAAAEGIRRVLDTEGGSKHVDEIRMGTTVATNALLERRGSQTGFLVTQGFKDCLEIGYQNRPAIFDLDIELPKPLYVEAAEVTERVDAAGKVLTDLDEAELGHTLKGWLEKGIESIAICFMHACKNPAHEQRAAQLARAAGFRQISVSHEVSRLIKLVSRGDTTVADAYLSPVLLTYVDSFRSALSSYGIVCPRVLFMQSNGGLVTADLFRGKDSILSGPAGGVVGMAAAAGRAGLDQLIGFDMGGTSTDVSVYAGKAETVNETTVAGIFLRTPMIRMHTIAAGGGSKLKFSRGRFQVGPESAGAAPGPMAYGCGGPLTVTDANLLLGRIQADHFPATFGPNADQKLDANSVSAAFATLASEVSGASGRAYTPAQTAQGFLRVAVENMANAISHISIERGLNPEDFTLCSFGGAGGQHACQVADKLGMSRILLDPLAGVLSAWGMGSAPLRSYQQRSIDEQLNASSLDEIRQQIPDLEQHCRSVLEQQGVTASDISTQTWLNLKLSGSDTSISIALADLAELHNDFAIGHRQRFGFMAENPQLIIESLRVDAEGGAEQSQAAPNAKTMGNDALAGNSSMFIGDTVTSVPVYKREHLRPGMQLTGPAIIAEQTGTTVLEPEWMLVVNDSLQLLLTRCTPATLQQEIDVQVDPVMLEIFSNHFMHIADEMGVVLRNTARSVNIKERLDFSCALFSPTGDLIANAPHIPVHLGSMDDSVKTLLREHANGLSRGNVYLSNAPYNGGTHLPDLTVISPVTDTRGSLLFIVASRAHHADIGGITPGSMPPNSKHIEEEGVVFDNFLLMTDERFRETELRQQLDSALFPARNTDQNVADCKAQIAANARGRHLLLDLVGRYGRAAAQAYVEHSLNNAEESVRLVIDDLASSGQLGEGSFHYPFDNGQAIHVKVSLDAEAREAHIDFTGTSASGDNNLNAPASVCQAAIMYVFRTLVKADIPLNAGCRRPLRLTIPDGSMLNPRFPAAVVGGNVETSQCVTDALFGALGVLAASQGTMNNLSFGDAELQYYETICGGAGAGDGFAGASAVQTHMTNSRMTDAEVLESRYPVIVREFSVRRGSGGAGKYTGGDGVIRKLEFRRTISAAILSNHRKVAPFGLAGGFEGKPGVNALERSAGNLEELGSIVTVEVHAGDVLVIETPGGGGYGLPSDEP